VNRELVFPTARLTKSAKVAIEGVVDAIDGMGPSPARAEKLIGSIVIDGETFAVSVVFELTETQPTAA